MCRQMARGGQPPHRALPRRHRHHVVSSTPRCVIQLSPLLSRTLPCRASTAAKSSAKSAVMGLSWMSSRTRPVAAQGWKTERTASE